MIAVESCKVFSTWENLKGMLIVETTVMLKILNL